ncbi:MAG: hypothetical protein R2855_09800 [Thermomicrobiales bacterium]
MIDTGHLRWNQVSSIEQLIQFERVMIEGFDMDDMRRMPDRSLFPQRSSMTPVFRAWLGYLDGRQWPGGRERMANEGLVDVISDALPQARRKEARADRHPAARPELGWPAVLFSSDEGRSVYERLGFVPILRGRSGIGSDSARSSTYTILRGLSRQST